MEAFRCNTCDINFSSRSSLSEHIDDKHVNASGDCFLCNKKIPKLLRHLKETHFGLAPPKNIKCPNCPMLFDELRRVFNHFNTAHQEMEEYGSGVCPLCDLKNGNLRHGWLPDGKFCRIADP